MSVEYGAWVDVGLKRERNEDSFFLDAFNGLFAVFDGMGGARTGELVADLCSDALVEFGNPAFPKESPFAEPLLVQAIKHVAKTVSDSQAPGGKFANYQFGSTVAAIQVLSDSVSVAHIGNSRVYRLSRGRLDCLTRDHMLHNDVEMLKRFTPEQIANIPKNVIMKAIGVGLASDPDFSSVARESGDLFLICSDGVHDLLTDEQIKTTLENQLLNLSDLEMAARSLVDAANAAGGTDNIAAVLVRLT